MQLSSVFARRTFAKSGISLRRMECLLRNTHHAGIKIPRPCEQVAVVQAPRVKLGNDGNSHEHGIDVGKVLLSVTEADRAREKLTDRRSQMVQIERACGAQIR